MLFALISMIYTLGHGFEKHLKGLLGGQLLRVGCARGERVVGKGMYDSWQTGLSVLSLKCCGISNRSACTMRLFSRFLFRNVWKLIDGEALKVLF